MDYGDDRTNERVAHEMDVAIALDSNFTMAWGRLATTRVNQAWPHQETAQNGLVRVAFSVRP